MTDKAEPSNYPETYYVAAYWGPRKESPEECAQRAATFLDMLAPCDPFLAHWFRLTKSRRDARKYPLMPPDVPTLTELFRRGVNRERGGPVFEDLGLRLWINNGGAAYDDSDLRMKCGAYGGTSPNSCILTLPYKGLNADRLLTAPVLADILRAMALAWEADWAVATSDHYRDILEKGGTYTFAGWVTYHSRRRGRVPPLPTPVRIEPVEDKGTLIILTPERLTASNPEHVEQGHRVHELLARAGLTQPLMP